MITIDNQQYKPEDLSEEARAHVAHLAFIEAEIRRLQMSVNVMNMARQRIGDLLKIVLPKTGSAVPVAAPAAVPTSVPVAVRAPAPTLAPPATPTAAAKPKNGKRKS